MKRGKKMFIIILSTLGLLALITWSAIAYLGRSQPLSIKSIENPSGDLYLIHITKPSHQIWKAGAYAKFTLPDASSTAKKYEAKGEQTSRWLTIASTPDEDEILILTHNSGSNFKNTLTHLPSGSEIEMSWLDSSLTVKDTNKPLVCFASDVGISSLRPLIKEWAGKCPIILNHFDKGVTIFDNE
ncbi:hypothetical protein, partial [Streptococcus sp. GMD6S]|uniref:hypothetical protein n=2 Tax=Streptococcus TaxID=1301 RepID=UPI000280DCCB